MRTQVLKDNNVIDDKSADYTMNMIDLVLATKPNIEEDKAEIFFTHLAMASQRAIDGLIENPLDDEVLLTVKEHPLYNEALALRNEMLSKTDIEFSQSEKDFLSAHICNFL
ncbi:PRD domain-containing protein [Treponema phagedenis]|nr:PRD domain-containing protein [Treponema phagedenis]